MLESPHVGPEHELVAIRPQAAGAKLVASVAEPTSPPFVGLVPAMGPTLATGALLGATVALIRIRKRWAARNEPVDRVRALDVGIALSGAAGLAALGLTAIAAGAPEVPDVTYSRPPGVEAQGRYVVRLRDPATGSSTYAVQMPVGVRPVSVKLSTEDLPDRAACVQATVFGQRLGRDAGDGESVELEVEETFFAEERSWVPAADAGLRPCPPASGDERSIMLPAYPTR